MIAAFARRIGEVLRDSGRIWLLAPLIPFIAIVPEFIQHVAEINMGMFDDVETARAVSNSDERWAYGYAKLAGYGLAILATIRFWAARREGLPWWSPKGIAWKVFGIALIANVAVGLLGEAVNMATSGLGETAVQAVEIVFAIATLPVVVLLVAGLVGDREATLLSVFRSGWGAALRIVILSAIVLAPLMWLHSQNHYWAMGQSDALVWTLMVFDSLVVGLLAVAWGTAIHHGYRPLRVADEGQEAQDPDFTPA